MTEPKTGPGTGSTSASAGAPAVPPQLGQQQGRGVPAGQQAEYVEYSEHAEYASQPGYGGDSVLAAAAGMSWAAVLAGALAMVGLGIVLLVWPHATLLVVAILIGAALVVSGLVKLFEGFTARGESGGMRAAYVVIGLLAVLAGLYCLRHHALSLFLVAFVTGVYFIMHGIADLGVAFSVQVPGRGLRGVLGVFSIAAGVIMVVWPAVTLVILLTIVAAWLIFYGLVLAGLAFSLRRASKAVNRPAGTMAAPARA